MNKRIKTIVMCLIVVTMIFVSALPAFAYVPYNTYNYNYYGETVGSPAGYVPDAFYLAEDLGISEIHQPTDIYVSDVDDTKEIYLLDLGAKGSRGRLCIFDENFKLIKEFKSLTNKDGTPYELSNPSGVTTNVEYFDDDKDGVNDRSVEYIYVCDTDNGAVLKLTKDGVIEQKFEQPGKEVFDESYTYAPYKIVIGINGAAYVISKGCLDGILEFNTSGEFVRFFGAPKVQLSFSDYVTIYWRKIYRSFGGSDVDEMFVTYVPTEFENIDIDDKGFIFSTVIANESSTNEASKLNFTGSNTLNPISKSTKKISDDLSSNYGDLQTVGKDLDNNFVDIVVDDDGFFSLLDKKLSKIFEYDAEGNLIFVYGGKGQQIGTLEAPSAMAKLGDKTIVVDQTTCAITVYKLSDYGSVLHEAVGYYNKGLYLQAEKQWKEVLRYNANSDLAHVGIGKVYYSNGDYNMAMEEFRLANDRENYSKAFALYREEVLKDNFNLIAIAIIVLIVVMFVGKKFGKYIINAIKERKNGGEIDG